MNLSLAMSMDALASSREGAFLSLLANDTFTDSNQELSLHTSDSGHSWTAITGQVDIVGNEASVITTPYHYILDSFSKQPKTIVIDIKDTLALKQTAGITIRDKGDGLDYIFIYLSAESFAVSLTIAEVIAGVSTIKTNELVFGDFRNSTDFFTLIVTDDGANTISVDATTVEPTLIASWNAAPLPTSNGIGLINTPTTSTTTLYDNLVIKG